MQAIDTSVAGLPSLMVTTPRAVDPHGTSCSFLPGRHAGLHSNATVGITEKFDATHDLFSLTPLDLAQGHLPSCMPVTGS